MPCYITLCTDAESCSDSETASGRNSGHYGFPGDAAQESQPVRRHAAQQQQQQQHRLGRFLSGGMSAADRAAVSEQLAQRSSGSTPGSGGASAAVQPQAGPRLQPRGQAAAGAGPAADAASAATAAAAPIVAAAAAAAAAGNVAAGRVYHALYRGRPGSTASASGAQTPAELAEPLVPGQARVHGCYHVCVRCLTPVGVHDRLPLGAWRLHTVCSSPTDRLLCSQVARSVCSDGDAEGASLIQPHAGSRMSRGVSHRSLTDTERRAVAEKWARMREVFVLWLVSSAVTLIVSW